MTERTGPLPPCRDRDDVAPFHAARGAARGFTRTCRQVARHADAADAERLPLPAFRAELLVRTGDDTGAAAFAAIRALGADGSERAVVAELERHRETNR